MLLHFCEHDAFLQVWSCEQYARAVVVSGPHHVDGLAIATCVAEEMQASSGRQISLALQQKDKQAFVGLQQAAVSSVC